MAYTADCKFKIATATGDTFTDAVAQDVIVSASDGLATRSFLAGFSSAQTGSVSRNSVVRIGSNAVTIQGGLYASSNVGIGLGTLAPVAGAVLDVSGNANFRSNVSMPGFSNVGGNSYMNSLSVAGNITALGAITYAGTFTVDNYPISTGVFSSFVTTMSPAVGDASGLCYWKIAQIYGGTTPSIYAPTQVTYALGGIIDIDGNFSNYNSLTQIKCGVRSVNTAPPNAVECVSETALGTSTISFIGGGFSNGIGGGQNCARIMVDQTNTGSAYTYTVWIVASLNTACNFTIRYDSNTIMFLTPLWGTKTYTNIIHDTSLHASIVKLPGNAILPVLTTSNMYSTGLSNVGGVTYTSNLVTSGAVSVTGNIACGGNISSGNLGLFRNRAINGDMRIDQRRSGVSQVATPIATVPTYAADRFAVYVSTNSAVTLAVQQMLVSAAPGVSTALAGQGFTNCVSLQASSASYTATSTDSLIMSQRIEALHLSDLAWGTANAVPLVLSFYVNATQAGGTFAAGIRYNATPPANATQTVAQTIGSTFTVASASTWQRVSIAIPGNITTSLPVDTSLGLTLEITLVSGGTIPVANAGAWQSGSSYGVAGMSNFLTSCATTQQSIYFTGVQLEKGTIVTPFEYRPYPTELALCQRYYSQVNAIANQRMITCVGYSNSTAGGIVNGMYQYPQTMRVVPTLCNSMAPMTGLGVGLPVYLPWTLSNSLNATDSTTTTASIQAVYSNTSAQAPLFFSGFYTAGTAVTGQYMQFSSEL